jgi:hypothetical protein
MREQPFSTILATIRVVLVDAHHSNFAITKRAGIGGENFLFVRQ